MFTISCTFTHTDDFTVSFYKDGVVITVEGLADITLTETQQNADPNVEKMLELTFSDFQQAHDGVYHCSASVEGVDPVSSEMYFYGSCKSACLCEANGHIIMLSSMQIIVPDLIKLCNVCVHILKVVW